MNIKAYKLSENKKYSGALHLWVQQ